MQEKNKNMWHDNRNVRWLGSRDLSLVFNFKQQLLAPSQKYNVKVAVNCRDIKYLELFSPL